MLQRDQATRAHGRGTTRSGSGDKESSCFIWALYGADAKTVRKMARSLDKMVTCFEYVVSAAVNGNVASALPAFALNSEEGTLS
jgi:hypothetical protein